MKKYICTLIFIVMITGCKESGMESDAGSGKQKKIKIEGLITGGHGRKLYLQQIAPNSAEILDSATIKKDGSFHLSTSASEPGLFFLRLEDGSAIIICVRGGERISIRSDYNNFMDYSISGSPESEELSLLARKTNEALNGISRLSRISMDSIYSPDYASIKIRLNAEFQGIVDDLREYSRNFIRKNQNSLICLIALKNEIGPDMHVLHPGNDRDIYLFADSVLLSNYPGSDLVISFHHELKDYLARNEAAAPVSSGLAVGQTVPEIALPSPEGQIIKLSSLRGKIVLLDFWAAWCPPCRAENPNLVAMYDKYRSKGFEIYQVSLDRTKEEWLKAIRDDKLNWAHVSDLKQWESEVVPAFGIQAIPASYLLDREGKIIALDPRGMSLNEKLHEIFNP
jgi:peroxiredoxin